MALDRGALEVVVQGAQTAEFGAAAGPAGAAVQELRHGGAVPGGFRGVVAVEYEQAAVPRCESLDEPGRDAGVAGDDGRARLPSPRAARVTASSMPS